MNLEASVVPDRKDCQDSLDSRVLLVVRVTRVWPDRLENQVLTLPIGTAYSMRSCNKRC